MIITHRACACALCCCVCVKSNHDGPSDWDDVNGDNSITGGVGNELQEIGNATVSDVPDEPEDKWIHWPTLAAYVGPGFLVCIAYLDPGNLEADLQVRS